MGLYVVNNPATKVKITTNNSTIAHICCGFILNFFFFFFDILPPQIYYTVYFKKFEYLFYLCHMVY